MKSTSLLITLLASLFLLHTTNLSYSENSQRLFSQGIIDLNQLMQQYREATTAIDDANKRLEKILGIPTNSVRPADTPEGEIERRRQIMNMQYQGAEGLLDNADTSEEYVDVVEAVAAEGFIVVDGGERRYFDNVNIERELFYRIRENFVANLLVVRKYNTKKRAFEKGIEYGLQTISTKINVENFFGRACTQWSHYSPKSCMRYSTYVHYEIDKGEVYPNFYSGVVSINQLENRQLEIVADAPVILFYVRDGVNISGGIKRGCTGARWTLSNREFEQLMRVGYLEITKNIGEQGRSASCVVGSKITLHLRAKKESPEKCKDTKNLKIEILSPSDGDRYIFNEQNPASLTLELKAKTTPAKYQDSIEWEVPEMEGSDRRIQSQSGSSTLKGPNVRVLYKGMPTNVGSFGRQKVKARIKVDGCTVEDTKEVLVFYPRDEKNNPQGKYPNWFYYWRQTPAAMPFGQNVRVAFQCEDIPINKCVCLQPDIMGQYNPFYSMHKTINVCDLNKNLPLQDRRNFTIRLPAIKLSIPSTLTSRNFLSYTHIDTFAVIIMHEFTHFNNALTFWTDGYNHEKDKDGDSIPDHIEPGLGLNPKERLTYWKDLLQGADDEELLTLEATYDYPVGKFDKYDWGKPGKNWQ